MNASKAYKDRRQAGRKLARALRAVLDDPDALILALPRGGVPVAFDVAREFLLPLDILLVKKLGMPGHEEFAIGAVGRGGVRVLQPEALEVGGICPDRLETICDRTVAELERRHRQYCGGRPLLDLADRTVVLVDDGIATGASMRAAIAVAEAGKPARIIVAAPVGAPDTCAALAPLVSALVCPLQPASFHAVGQWYRAFDQTSDEEVIDLLALAWRARPPPPARLRGADARR